MSIDISALTWIRGQRWMMHPSAYGQMLLAASRRDALAEDEEPATPEPETAESGVLVLPIRGVMMPHPGDYSCGMGWETYTEWWTDAFRMALEDETVTGIAVPIDSPGGIVWGTPEMAEAIYEARDVKPAVGLANPMAASAALWVGTAFERFYVQPSGDVGSHGVVGTHVDLSEALEQMGVNVTFITSSKYKVEGNAFEPLSDEAREHWQEEVDAIHADFTAALARHRDMDPETVEATFGEGRMLDARKAVEVGMVDGILTLDEVLEDLADEAGGGEDDDALPPEVRDVPGPSEYRQLIPDGAECRNLTTEVRANGDGEAETLEGLAVPFGSLSRDLGGFRETFVAGPSNIDDPDLVVLWQHDAAFVFGRVSAGTARFSEDDDGVRYEADPPDVEWARGAMEAVRRGDVSRSSFVFRVREGGDRFERRDGELVRVVEDWDLFEASPVTFAAYEDTSVAVARAQAFLDREARMKGEATRERGRWI